MAEIAPMVSYAPARKRKPIVTAMRQPRRKKKTKKVKSKARSY